MKAQHTLYRVCQKEFMKYTAAHETIVLLEAYGRQSDHKVGKAGAGAAQSPSGGFPSKRR